MEKLYSVEEAAKLLGLSKSTLYKFTTNRIIEFFKPNGKKIWFSETQIRDFLSKSVCRTSETILKTL